MATIREGADQSVISGGSQGIIPRNCPGGVRRVFSEPGNYVLILRARKSFNLQIGKRGILRAPAGWFAYTGSAAGPGGLRGRLSHHVRAIGRPHWHIDTLRTVCELREAWAFPWPRPDEHLLSKWLQASEGSRIPLARFGASDCRCASHLTWFRTRPRHGSLLTSADTAVRPGESFCLSIGLLRRLLDDWRHAETNAGGQLEPEEEELSVFG